MGSPPPMSDDGSPYSSAIDTSSHDLISPPRASSLMQLREGMSNQRSVSPDAVMSVVVFLVHTTNLMISVCTPSPISNAALVWIVTGSSGELGDGELGRGLTSARSKMRSFFS